MDKALEEKIALVLMQQDRDRAETMVIVGWHSRARQIMRAIDEHKNEVREQVADTLTDYFSFPRSSAYDIYDRLSKFFDIAPKRERNG